MVMRSIKRGSLMPSCLGLDISRDQMKMLLQKEGFKLKDYIQKAVDKIWDDVCERQGYDQDFDFDTLDESTKREIKNFWCGIIYKSACDQTLQS